MASHGRPSFIGIDLGGTKVKGVLADDGGRVLAFRELPTAAEEGEEAVFGRVLALALGLREYSVQLEGIAAPLALGIGAPGPLDAAGGRILVTENLPFVDFPIGPRLEEALGLPVSLDNDGNAAAMGEYLYGAGRGADPLLYLTVSTGIGAGAIIGGKVFRGFSSNALEAGHMTLEPGGALCICGNRGCVEALASGSAIAAQARAAAQASRDGSGPPTSLGGYAAPDSREVFLEAERGDAVAEGIVSRALSYIGIAAANLATLFDPESLVVGGGVTRAGPRVLESIRAAVTERCAAVVARGLRISPPALGADSGALGAAALAAQAHPATARKKGDQ